MLARLTTRDARSRGSMSLRRCGRACVGALLQLVFAPLRQGHPILILQDGPSMHLWQRKVEAFVKGMQQRRHRRALLLRARSQPGQPQPRLAVNSSRRAVPPQQRLTPAHHQHWRECGQLLGQLALALVPSLATPRLASPGQRSRERWHPMLAELPQSGR